jgi:hypothetical protein
LSDDPENSAPPTLKSGLAYTESAAAPIIFFDGVSCHGTMHGIIEIELAARIMAPAQDGLVEIKFIPAGRLRCSVAAAAALLDSIQSATKMAEEPHPQQPAAASKLN